MDNEAEIIRTIDKNQDRIIDNLQRFIQVPSIVPPGEEGKLAPVIAEVMRNIGLRVDVEEVLPNRPNVIGVLGDSEKPTLLFNGHMDVVPAGNGWTIDPFSGEIHNGKIYGRGAADMKGGLVSMIAAAEALVETNVSLNGRLVLAAVSDEEDISRGTMKMIDQGFTADMAVVGEPTNLGICVAHKGCVMLDIVAKGKSAHASTPQEGVNAIVIMSRILRELEKLSARISERKHSLLGCPTLSVDLIRGGVKDNMVPDLCELYVDIYSIPGETDESWISEIESLIEDLKKSDQQLEATVRRRFGISWLPLLTSPKENVVQILTYAFRKALGKEPYIMGFSGCSDGSFLSNIAKIPTLLFGPGHINQAHAVDEYVEVEQVVSAAKVYALVAAKALSL